MISGIIFCSHGGSSGCRWSHCPFMHLCFVTQLCRIKTCPLHHYTAIVQSIKALWHIANPPEDLGQWKGSVKQKVEIRLDFVPIPGIISSGPSLPNQITLKMKYKYFLKYTKIVTILIFGLGDKEGVSFLPSVFQNL